MKFEDFSLSKETLKSISIMGYEEPTPIQVSAIPMVMGGADLVGQAQTGTGKTAVVKFVGKELLKKGEQTGKKVNFIYMNCEIVDTQYRLLQNIANRFINEWNDHVPFTGWPTDEVYSKVKAIMDMEKFVPVLVLDEIDKL